jgi:Predicted unusual protein kinase
MSRTSQILSLTRELSAIKLSGKTNKQDEYKRAIFYSLKNMGGVYVKYLQVMSINHDFMKGWSGPREQSVFNKVELERIDIDDYITDRSQYSWYNREPFAAGSFAQVYKAQLVSGEEVVVKVLRPSIVKNLDSDLRFLKRITKIISGFLPKTLIDYSDAVNEFCKNTKLETDYEREISNTEYFYDFYKDSKYVKIPKVYREFSNKNVIVQEYVGGLTFADVLTMREIGRNASQIVKEEVGTDLWSQLTLAGGELLRTAMTAEFVFGDPHPGNIKLLPDGRIGFIDFGIIAEKPTSQRYFRDWVQAYHEVLSGCDGLSRLIETTITCFCPDIADAFKNCTFTDAENTKISALDAITNALDNKMDHLKNDEVASGYYSTGHLFQLFYRVLDKNNAMNIRMDISNFQLLKSTQAFLASLTSLDNQEGPGGCFSKSMKAAMDYALRYAEINGVKDDVAKVPKYSVAESYEIVMDTIASLAEGDQFLFEYLSSKM